MSVSPLILADQSTVRGPSASDPSLLISNSGEASTEESLLIEAEDLNLDGIFQVATIGSGEDSFEVIDLRRSSGNGSRNITGEASFIVGSELADVSDISLSTRSANLTISTFDEGDGVGTIQVRVNDEIIEIFDDGEFPRDFITLNETPSSGPNFPNEDIRQEFTFDLGAIEAGDEIKIIGTSNEEEFVRLDFITMVLISNSVN